MKRFQVDRDGDSLTLSMPMDFSRFAVGGLMFLIAMASNMILALFSVWQADRSDKVLGTLGPLELLEPHANPFGFLWALSAALIVILIPLYALRLRASGLEYVFNRGLGMLFRNGRELTPTGRIEGIEVRRLPDPDGGHWYRLVIVYGDGEEIYIDDSYDENEVVSLAYDISDYALADVVRVARPRSHSHAL